MALRHVCKANAPVAHHKWRRQAWL